MPAVVLEVADAVTAALNAATLSQSFTAERLYVPVYGKQDEDADEFAELQISVVPDSIRSLSTSLSRKADDFEYVIDVGIQQRVDGTTAVLDALMLLAQEIMDLFRGKQIPNYPAALCTNAANSPIYAPTHLAEQKVFTSVVSLTFKVARDQMA